MGFWDWLTGKPKSVEAVDVVWTSQEAKFRGLLKQIQEQLQPTQMILMVAHFPMTLARLQQECEQKNLPCRVEERHLYPADFLRIASLGDASLIVLAQADALIPDEFPNTVDDKLTPLTFFVAERHFLRSSDDRIVSFARSLGRRCRLSFHVSLQDPLMRGFAGEWVRGILNRLGMKDSDSIESTMVARRIKGIQAKFAKQVTNEQTADSAEEWFTKNVSSMV